MSSTSCAPLARQYAPDLLLVSAGFDAHARGPAGRLPGDRRRLRRDGGADARDWPTSWESRLGLVLEGGYDLAALSRSVVLTLEVLGAPGAPSLPDVALHPLALRAQERLAAHWPALA